MPVGPEAVELQEMPEEPEQNRVQQEEKGQQARALKEEPARRQELPSVLMIF